MYAKIQYHDETRTIYHDSWYRLPVVEGCTEKLGYWESRFKLFVWACNCAGFDPEQSLFIDDGQTLDYYTLADECADDERAANIDYTFTDDNTVTVSWYDIYAHMTYEYSGLEFRPITPNITHIYDANFIKPEYLGAINSENETQFKLQLVELLS